MSVEGESEWRALGTHRYRELGPIFWLETHGDLTVTDAMRAMDELTSMSQQESGVGVILDVRDGFSIPPETRRMVTQHAAMLEWIPVPMAIFGANLAIRALMMLLVGAIRIARRREVPTVFVKDEAAARAWLIPQMAERARRMTSKA